MLTWAATMIAFAATTLAAPAEDVTPPPDLAPGSWLTVALKAKPSTGMWMGSLHVVLEQTTLSEIRKAVAAGGIASQGEAGEGISWLCYTNLSSPAPERIWISTQNEMGGPERRVMGVTARLLSTGLATADCPALPAALTPVRIDNHLWLHDTAQEVANELHSTVNAGQERLLFSYSGKVGGSGGCRPDGLDLLNDLAVTFRAGRVVSVRIDQVTSC